MPTTFYPTTTSRAGVTVPAAWSGATLLALELTRGSGAASQTDATAASLSASIVGRGWGDSSNGPTFHNGSFAGLVFISNPLNAFSTDRSTTTANIRALESNAMANYGVAVQTFRLTPAGVITTIDDRCSGGTELGTTESARSCTTSSSSASFSFAAGDRLVAMFGYNGVGGSASGFTATGFYNGPTAGASGDTSVTLPETITEQAVVAERVPYRNIMPPLIAQ